MACLFIKPITLAFEAYNELETQAENIRNWYPDWINECIDYNVKIDFDEINESANNISGVASSVRNFALLLTVYCSMVIFALVLLIVGFVYKVLAEACR